jgi:hypothetical protein
MILERRSGGQFREPDEIRTDDALVRPLVRANVLRDVRGGGARVVAVPH